MRRPRRRAACTGDRANSRRRAASARSGLAPLLEAPGRLAASRPKSSGATPTPSALAWPAPQAFEEAEGELVTLRLRGRACCSPAGVEPRARAQHVRRATSTLLVCRASCLPAELSLSSAARGRRPRPSAPRAGGVLARSSTRRCRARPRALGARVARALPDARSAPRARSVAAHASRDGAAARLAVRKRRRGGGRRARSSFERATSAALAWSTCAPRRRRWRAARAASEGAPAALALACSPLGAAARRRAPAPALALAADRARGARRAPPARCSRCSALGCARRRARAEPDAVRAAGARAQARSRSAELAQRSRREVIAHGVAYAAGIAASMLALAAAGARAARARARGRLGLPVPGAALRRGDRGAARRLRAQPVRRLRDRLRAERARGRRRGRAAAPRAASSTACSRSCWRRPAPRPSSAPRSASPSRARRLRDSRSSRRSARASRCRSSRSRSFPGLRALPAARRRLDARAAPRRSASRCCATRRLAALDRSGAERASTPSPGLLALLLASRSSRWLFGVAQRARGPLGGAGRRCGRSLAALARRAAAASTERPRARRRAIASAAALRAPPRSTQRCAAGRPVFVYFTADWCLTCKLNERRVLDTTSACSTSSRASASPCFRADWTRRDAAIGASWRASARGRAGLRVYRPGARSRACCRTCSRERRFTRRSRRPRDDRSARSRCARCRDGAHRTTSRW